MPKGKPWTIEDEKRLRQLVQEGKPINTIAEVLSKTEDAVYHKCKRLGLPVEEGAKAYTSSSIKLPEELPSVEETLRILAGALTAATESGLEKVDAQRLQVISTLSRTYKELLADYLDYRGVETQLLELKRKYEVLAKETQDSAA